MHRVERLGSGHLGRRAALGGGSDNLTVWRALGDIDDGRANAMPMHRVGKYYFEIEVQRAAQEVCPGIRGIHRRGEMMMRLCGYGGGNGWWSDDRGGSSGMGGPGPALETGDVVGFAVNLDAQLVRIFINGKESSFSNGGKFPTTVDEHYYVFPFVELGLNSAVRARFDGEFAYPPPAGYQTWTCKDWISED